MTISQVSSRTGLPADTLRYYERCGLLGQVGRTSGGIRNYTEENCRRIEYLKCMRSAGISVEALVEYFTLLDQGSSTIPARKELLLEQRAQIAARIERLQEVLARLDYKLDGYEERMLRWEQSRAEQQEEEA